MSWECLQEILDYLKNFFNIKKAMKTKCPLKKTRNFEGLPIFETNNN